MEITARSVRLIIAFGLWSAAVSSLASADIPAPNAKYYENVDYQFSVDLPHGLHACVSEHTNHGVVIYLDPGVKCGTAKKGVAYIGIFADYNVPYEARTPARLARIACRDADAKRIEWLYSAALGGRRAAGCRQYFAGGRILVQMIALRKTEGPIWEWIQVAAYLDTRARRYDSDMRIFRGVLSTVWIHPDGPHH